MLKKTWQWITGSAFVLMLAALVHPISTPVALAAGIVVNPGGGGNYTTIQAAINNATPGDSILIKTGTYNENLDRSEPAASRLILIRAVRRVSRWL